MAWAKDLPISCGHNHLTVTLCYAVGMPARAHTLHGAKCAATANGANVVGYWCNVDNKFIVLSRRVDGRWEDTP